MFSTGYRVENPQTLQAEIIPERKFKIPDRFKPIRYTSCQDTFLSSLLFFFCNSITMILYVFMFCAGIILITIDVNNNTTPFRHRNITNITDNSISNETTPFIIDDTIASNFFNSGRNSEEIKQDIITPTTIETITEKIELTPEVTDINDDIPTDRIEEPHEIEISNNSSKDTTTELNILPENIIDKNISDDPIEEEITTIDPVNIETTTAEENPVTITDEVKLDIENSEQRSAEQEQNVSEYQTTKETNENTVDTSTPTSINKNRTSINTIIQLPTNYTRTYVQPGYLHGCTEEGIFPNPSKCNKYLKCTPRDSEVIKANHITCPKRKVYNYVTLGCTDEVYLVKVPECTKIDHRYAHLPSTIQNNMEARRHNIYQGDFNINSSADNLIQYFKEEIAKHTDLNTPDGEELVEYMKNEVRKAFKRLPPYPANI